MTSKSLSFSDRYNNYKKYISRTLWSSIVGFLFMAIYYILGVTLAINRTINYARINNQSAKALQHYKYNASGLIFGFEQIGFVIIICIAIAFAFQSFSYVLDQKKLDFYLSQPTTRAQRFWSNYIRAILTFICMYLLVEILALIVAAAMGGVNNVVLITAILEFVRSIILFFAIYNISVLAILLCGTMPISLLLLMFLLAVTLVIGYEFYYFKEIFFATFSYNSAGVIASPLYDRIKVFSFLKSITRNENYYSNLDGFKRSLEAVLPGTADTLITGIAALILDVCFSRKRKAEHAGKTICYRPVRWLVKIVGCSVVGLGAGFLVYAIYDYLWTDRSFILMFIVMLLATAICGCAIEAILESNIKKLFMGKAQTVMALAIVSLVFVIYKGDLLGFDSYVPSPSSVESCAFIDYDYSFYLGDNFFSFSGENMKITDVDRFTQVAKLGMEKKKELRAESKNGEYKDLGWETTILYRLKSGREVYRDICIPYDIDKDLLAGIIDSPEYKTGHFFVFDDESLRAFDESIPDNTISFETSTGTYKTTKMPYSELSDAYRKDVLDIYSFELASNTLPIGRIDYDPNISVSYLYNGYSTSGGWNVYENFENTIAVLEKYGIYPEGDLDVECIVSVEVTNYYPGVDFTEEDIESYDNMNVESSSVTYTDADSIQKILDSSVCAEYFGDWFDYESHFERRYGIKITLNKQRDQYGSSTVYYDFKLGKVPEFVIKDTN